MAWLWKWINHSSFLTCDDLLSCRLSSTIWRPSASAMEFRVPVPWRLAGRLFHLSDWSATIWWELTATPGEWSRSGDLELHSIWNWRGPKDPTASHGRGSWYTLKILPTTVSIIQLLGPWGQLVVSATGRPQKSTDATFCAVAVVTILTSTWGRGSATASSTGVAT